MFCHVVFMTEFWKNLKAGNQLSRWQNDLLLRNRGIATGFSPISRYTENFGKKPMCSDVKNK